MYPFPVEVTAFSTSPVCKHIQSTRRTLLKGITDDDNAGGTAWDGVNATRQNLASVMAAEHTPNKLISNTTSRPAGTGHGRQPTTGGW